MIIPSVVGKGSCMYQTLVSLVYLTCSESNVTASSKGTIHKSIYQDLLKTLINLIVLLCREGTGFDLVLSRSHN